MASGVAGAGRDDQETDQADAVAGHGKVHDAEGAYEASERPGRDYPATEELEHEGKWWERGLLVEELRELTTMALPVVVTYAAQHCLILVLFAFVGRSGEGEEGLAVAGLASMFANFSGISIVVGLSSGLETLASQAYGAGKFRLVGVLTQRAAVVLTSACVPVVFAWLFSSPLLQACGIEPGLADGVQEFTRILIVSLPALIAQEVLRKFLLAQGLMAPLLYCGALAFLLHVPCCYALVQLDVLGIGAVRGGAVSLVLSYYLGDALVLAHTLCRGLHRKTFHGWTWEALQLSQIVEYLQLAVPGAGQICLEWWCFEIQTLISAQLGTAVLAAQTVMFNSTAIAFMMPLGIGIACTARVGNALGAGRAGAARRAAIISVALCIASTTVLTVLYLSFREEWVRLFTNEAAVVDLTVSVIPIQASFLVFDALNAVNAGILRGCGNQRVGFLANMICFYAVGTPAGVYLAFPLSLGLHGLWYGLALGCCSQVFAVGAYNARADWAQLATSARARVLRQEGDAAPGDVPLGEVGGGQGGRKGEHDQAGLLHYAV